MSLYHSDFYDLLSRLNIDDRWRRIIGQPGPDVHLKDIEFLLRGAALLIDGTTYAAPMSAFLNGFSRRTMRMDESARSRLEEVFQAFFESTKRLPEDAFFNQNRRFSMPVFESVFVAVGRRLLSGHAVRALDPRKVEAMKRDEDFLASTGRQRTTDKTNVSKRIGRAEAILFPE